MEPQSRESRQCPLRHGPRQDDGADRELLRLLALVREHGRFLAAACLLPGVATLLACLLVIPETYLSRAAILPVEAARENSLLPAALAERLPITLDFVERKEDRTIMAFLRSRTLRERLMADGELLRRLFDRPWDRLLGLFGLAPTPSIARAIQEERVEDVFRVRRKPGEAVIELSWESRDPEFGARMLGRALAELRHFLEREHESDATRQRRFIETQAAKASEALAAWESRTPGAELNLPRIRREIAAAAALHAELTSRLAMAKIVEAREIISFKVLDEPFHPVKKHWPRTGLLTAGAMAAGLLAGLLWVFARQAWNASGEPRAPS